MQPKRKLDNLWIVRCFLSIFLFGQVLIHIVQGKTYHREIFRHMETVGPNSISPVLLVNLFAGMIFTLQIARELVKFGAVNTIGGAFSLAFCRELAPILTASIIAGQVGSAYAAEIGAMRVTEQIDALYMLRTDPVDYLILPRVIACCVMMPIMIIFASMTGIVGGLFVAFQLYHVEPAVFLESVRDFLEPSDLYIFVLKGIIFGAIISINGCSWGLTTKGGAKEVGESATTAVVTTWVAIFIMDFILALSLFENPI